MPERAPYTVWGREHPVRWLWRHLAGAAGLAIDHILREPAMWHPREWRANARLTWQYVIRPTIEVAGWMIVRWIPRG